MTELKQDGLGAVVDAAREGQIPRTVDPATPTIVVVPEGVRPVEIDLSAWRDNPTRKTGVYRPATVDAFAAYVEQHTDPSVTTVWVHPTSGQVVAVFDDNGQETPGWGQHRAELNLETTPEWDHWATQDGNMMSQSEFADHIEVGLDDIAAPDGADVLEMAQTFHAKSSVQFRQATRLTSGETQFQYDEELQATAGKTGTLEIPQVLMLALSPFVGEERYKVTARLRYRLNSGKLTLGYKLDRPESVQRDALEKVAETLGEKFPLTYVGSAPA